MIKVIPCLCAACTPSIRIAHALALVCFGKLQEIGIFLKLSIHDSLDPVHVFRCFWTLELLVAEEGELVKDLTGSWTLLLALKLLNGWL